MEGDTDSRGKLGIFGGTKGRFKENDRLSHRESDPGPAKYELRVLITQPRHFDGI
jgi:hypothetical protein